MKNEIACAALALVLAAPGCSVRYVGAGDVRRDLPADAGRPGGGTGAGAEVGADEGELAAWLERELVAYFPCAASPWSPDNPHHMSHGLQRRGGWDRFYSTQVSEAIERFGYRRVFFHLPFGKPTGQSPREVEKRRTGRDDDSLDHWHMSLDHEHDLRRTGNEHISREFYAAMRRLHAEHPGVEVIVYLGSWDMEDVRYLESAGEAALMARWHESIDPLIGLDYVSLVFDAAVGKDRDHPNARLVQWAHEQKARQPGRFVGVEARIQKARPWPNELCLPVVAWEDVFRRQGHARNIPTEELCAPAIRVIDGRARTNVLAEGERNSAQAWIEIAADIAADGHVPAVPTALGGDFDDRIYRLPDGRAVRLPETVEGSPFRIPVDALAALIAAEVRQRGG